MNAAAHGNFSGKRLVIFGAGYVGSAMAREGMARGMVVTALTRNENKATALRELGVHTIVADLAERGWHAHLPGAAQFVLNCVSSGGGGLTGYERSYFGGMNSIAAWAAVQGAVGTIAYTSSTSVYPQGGGARIDETAPTEGGGDRAQVLLATEAVLRAAGPNAWARWFVLRLAGIYGPERHHLLEQVRGGQVTGRGDHHLNLIHLEDICAAIWSVFGAPSEIANEVFNVADDGAAPKAEITAWMATQLGLPTPRFSGEPAVGRRNVTPDRVISNAKLKMLLGWEPRYPSFRDGYAALLRA